MSNVCLPLISIHRHRLGIDGKGVTTLVGAYGCPLKCKYCLNPHAWAPGTKYQNVTPEELLDKVKIDHLYFLATGGGIVFGGGESLLHSDFIREFRSICPPQWQITVETSLNVPPENLQKVVDVVDEYIVDIKDMNPGTYESYTGNSNFRVMQNLKTLREHIDSQRVLVRVPLIPRFNKREDLDNSCNILREMGFTNFDVFSYVIRKKPET
ncbi:MAG: radical SAM protein [Lachnospiraceae bacterium]|nr:radical SAM protein [Lachnospiraceae bacterium]